MFLCLANDLDEMLKQMNTNLVTQGIRAASKGNCGACGKPVMGEVCMIHFFLSFLLRMFEITLLTVVVCFLVFFALQAAFLDESSQFLVCEFLVGMHF